MYLPRHRHQTTILELLEEFPVAAIVGPRQVGKTTLARMLADAYKSEVHWFDLELPRDQRRLEDPMLGLEGLGGLVVIDEIQRLPELFPVIRVLADRPEQPCRFLVLGSASPHLLRQSSETLAGRIAYHELTGFNLDEVGLENTARLWLRGGFPKSYLARSDKASMRWREQFIRTYLERDLPQLGFKTPATTLRRFWSMLAHYHGQIWNGSELGRAFGVSHTTVRKYLDTLTSTFVVRQLPAWFENLSKRQVKAPKVYIRDSGILHTLLSLHEQEDLQGHPKVGASWEGFALEEVIANKGVRPEECFFWATHGGAEIDLVVVRGRGKLGFEFKRTSAPRKTKSMKTAVDSLRLSELSVIYPGEIEYRLDSTINAVPLSSIWEQGR
jgi:uncharacterized protein